MRKQVPFTYADHTALLTVPNTSSIDDHSYRLLNQWDLPVFLLPSNSLDAPSATLIHDLRS